MHAPFFFVECFSQLLQRFFLKARDIAAGNVQLFCDFSLHKRSLSRKPVAQQNDLALARRKTGLHRVVQLPHLHAQVDVLQNVVVRRDGVEQRQRVAVLVGIDRVVQRHVLRRLFRAAEEHQNLIFNAPRSVARKPNALCRVEAVHSLDEPHRANGNEVVAVIFIGIVFLRNVRHKP